MAESFPRQQARTRGFSLGAPRSFQISPDGDRVVFLRSRGGSDPVTCLWVLEVASGQEWLAADPALAGDTGDVPDEEKARRERSRETAAGIVAFATDRAFTVAAFMLGGQVYIADLTAGGAARNGGDAPGAAGGAVAAAGGAGGAPRPVPARVPALDPRPDPTGERLAYVCEGALRVTDLGTGTDTELIGPAGTPGLMFGLAEFVAAEEMGRLRGYWWAPDGQSLLVARVDESPVNRWHIADAANPAQPPVQVAYPAAGTPNADVSLLLVGLDGSQLPVEWDRAAFPYLVTVDWQAGADPLIVVQSRDQRRLRLLAADPARGAVALLREDSDERWLDIVPGVPVRTARHRIVWTAETGGARRLLVAAPEELAEDTAVPVTPPDLQVREVLAVDGETVLLAASPDEPTEIGVWAWNPAGLACLTGAGGIHSGRRAGGTTVIASRSLAADGLTVRVLRDSPGSGGGTAGGGGGVGGTGGGTDGPAEGADGLAATEAARIASLAEQPNLPAPQPALLAAGTRQIRTALLLPSGHRPGSAKLPVLMDPYGGPHAQRVLAARGAFGTSQWFAEQGFAVVIADGRGTPGRGPDWDRAVWHDLAGPVLEDQVEALSAAAEHCGDLDLSRVAIRGWSFGGYLAALAVLRRPDVFHAAVAGAPVTDWRLYDTHYTERYLGQPGRGGGPGGDPYDACSLLGDASRLSRPLLIIHGLADDNVVAAHTLRFSAALLAAGRPHAVLPLSGVTHMTPQEEVAENLLLLQVDFLHRALREVASDRPPWQPVGDEVAPHRV